MTKHRPNPVATRGRSASLGYLPTQEGCLQLQQSRLHPNFWWNRPNFAQEETASHRTEARTPPPSFRRLTTLLVSGTACHLPKYTPRCVALNRLSCHWSSFLAITMPSTRSGKRTGGDLPSSNAKRKKKGDPGPEILPPQLQAPAVGTSLRPRPRRKKTAPSVDEESRPPKTKKAAIKTRTVAQTNDDTATTPTAQETEDGHAGKDISPAVGQIQLAAETKLPPEATGSPSSAALSSLHSDTGGSAPAIDSVFPSSATVIDGFVFGTGSVSPGSIGLTGNVRTLPIVSSVHVPPGTSSAIAPSTSIGPDPANAPLFPLHQHEYSLTTPRHGTTASNNVLTGLSSIPSMASSPSAPLHPGPPSSVSTPLVRFVEALSSAEAALGTLTPTAHPGNQRFPNQFAFDPDGVSPKGTGDTSSIGFPPLAPWKSVYMSPSSSQSPVTAASASVPAPRSEGSITEDRPVEDGPVEVRPVEDGPVELEDEPVAFSDAPSVTSIVSMSSQTSGINANQASAPSDFSMPNAPPQHTSHHNSDTTHDNHGGLDRPNPDHGPARTSLDTSADANVEDDDDDDDWEDIADPTADTDGAKISANKGKVPPAASRGSSRPGQMKAGSQAKLKAFIKYADRFKLALAKETGKSLDTIAKLIGRPPLISSKAENRWQVWQSWYAEHYPQVKAKEGDSVEVEDSDAFACRKLKAYHARLAGLNTPQEKKDTLKDCYDWWYTKRQEFLGSLIQSGKSSKLVTLAARQITSMSEHWHAQTGIHVFGIIIDTQGDNYIMAGGSPHWLRMKDDFPKNLHKYMMECRSIVTLLDQNEDGTPIVTDEQLKGLIPCGKLDASYEAQAAATFANTFRTGNPKHKRDSSDKVVRHIVLGLCAKLQVDSSRFKWGTFTEHLVSNEMTMYNWCPTARITELLPAKGQTRNSVSFDFRGNADSVHLMATLQDDRKKPWRDRGGIPILLAWVPDSGWTGKEDIIDTPYGKQIVLYRVQSTQTFYDMVVDNSSLANTEGGVKPNQPQPKKRQRSVQPAPAVPPSQPPPIIAAPRSKKRQRSVQPAPSVPLSQPSPVVNPHPQKRQRTVQHAPTISPSQSPPIADARHLAPSSASQPKPVRQGHVLGTIPTKHQHKNPLLQGRKKARMQYIEVDTDDVTQQDPQPVVSNAMQEPTIIPEWPNHDPAGNSGEDDLLGGYNMAASDHYRQLNLLPPVEPLTDPDSDPENENGILGSTSSQYEDAAQPLIADANYALDASNISQAYAMYWPMASEHQHPPLDLTGTYASSEHTNPVATRSLPVIAEVIDAAAGHNTTRAGSAPQSDDFGGLSGVGGVSQYAAQPMSQTIGDKSLDPPQQQRLRTHRPWLQPNIPPAYSTGHATQDNRVMPHHAPQSLHPEHPGKYPPSNIRPMGPREPSQQRLAAEQVAAPPPDHRIDPYCTSLSPIACAISRQPHKLAVPSRLPSFTSFVPFASHAPSCKYAGSSVTVP
ncbi:hypothetical protein PUNSTDRAFT_44628 [Punctularia strigosozonata HHB-11173 SS5]|uniref:uncharacterized protein n=1 Tax=Punctularia strigosozonata (strain HHB-11173) TaxID=741275 RepID=UPI0004417EBA|nr:uncharacterized protein PUNSTDRAFT_44628 [Punctularia strigosozonata HHB-11173 SS5]EIN09229.1 hypothetical protein PUNSTDRAFT_44628 [Punctularia strigosozonata HHB-11173 SS5]